MESEIHIAGVMIQTSPGHSAAVAAAVAALPGTEIHAISEAGKLVVICEAASGADVLDLIARMRELPGVADAALVYQHSESAAAIEEEIGHEGDPQGLH